ncbi:hypothetical protein [Alsobacter sp. SYSU BS001988]
MVAGWAVRVSFIFGGQVVRDGQPLYHAAYSDPSEAVGAIRRVSRLESHQAQIEAVAALPAEALGVLKTGQVIRRY